MRIIEQLTVTTERVDGIPFLLAQMERMRIPERLNEHFEPHGNKKATETDPILQGDLEELLEPKGDPMNLVKAFSQQGHRIKKSALVDLFLEQGYSLQINKKTMEGVSHADCYQQFGHINPLCKQFEQKQAPAVPIDCKKKKLLGTFNTNSHSVIK